MTLKILAWGVLFAAAVIGPFAIMLAYHGHLFGL